MLVSLSVVVLLLFAIGNLGAQSWDTATELPKVDFSGLSSEQKNAALKLLREEQCTCGCSMKIAQCRVQDPNCSESRPLAAAAVAAFRDGKSLNKIKSELAALGSELARRRSAPRPVLEDPVRIPTEGSPTKGPDQAKITIVEFSDFECPYCSMAVAKLYKVLEAYPNDVRLIYKQFPLSSHPRAGLAAEAALAAHAQNKFWPMHDHLFRNFRKLSRENILAWAKELGLDIAKFTADLDSRKFRTIVEKDVNDGQNAGVSGTPSIFVNGKHYNGSLDLTALKSVLEAELK